MPVSNEKLFLFFRFVLGLLLLVIVVDLFFAQLPGRLSVYFEHHIPAIVSACIIFLLAFVRVNYFRYEDEYEIVHITAKSLLFSKFSSPANTRYEFPKRLITNFEFKDSLFQKRLVIHLETAEGAKRIRKFDLNFVPKHKLNYVLNSLEKIKSNNNRQPKFL
jgi:hypothetical protein